MKTTVIIFLCFIITRAAAQTPFWQRVNGPCGGIINAIAVGPNNYLFASVAGSNALDIYRSTNNGAGWSPTTNYPTSFIWARGLATSPNGHIFAVSDNNGAGVFRSTDDADTWMQVDSGLAWRNVRCIAINRTGKIFIGLQGVGVYQSDNDGESWTLANNGFTGWNVLALTITSQSHIFAATFDSGIFRSTDNGNSWMQINAGLVGAQMYSVGVGSHDDIFAGSYDGRMFRSTNDGLNWTQVNNGLPFSTVNAIIASNSSVFVATDSAGVFRSTDNGESWIRKTSGLPYKGTLSLAVDSSGRVFVGTFNGGIFFSTDDGESWSPANRGLASLGVTVVQLNPGGTIFTAAYYDAGAFSSTDNGDNWIPIFVGAPGKAVWSLAVNSRNKIFLSCFPTTYRSTDNGYQWLPVDTLDNFFSGGDLRTTPNGDVWAGVSGTLWGGILRSTDDGVNWTQVFSGESIEAYTVSSSGTIFVAMSSYDIPSYHRMYRSMDSGTTWTYSDLGSWLGIHDIAVNSSGHVFLGSEFGVFRSTDNGDTWTATSNVRSTHVLAINRRDYIFAGTYDGAVRSTDNGDTWDQINTGLPISTSFSSFTFDSSGRILAASPYGLFRSIEPTTSVTDANVLLPHSFELFQNYPNPFNPGTYIEYDVASKGRVKLTIYNVLGEEINRLVDVDKAPGHYTALFDGSRHPSGMYIVKLSAGSFVATKKMVLMK